MNKRIQINLIYHLKKSLLSNLSIVLAKIKANFIYRLMILYLRKDRESKVKIILIKIKKNQIKVQIWIIFKKWLEFNPLNQQKKSIKNL